MLNNKALEAEIGFKPREEEFMREFFLDRVQEESVLSGQSFMYLHYADMIANGYIRTMPCPFQSQGLLLNPNGDLFYCENSSRSATFSTRRPRRCTSRRRTWRTARTSRTTSVPPA